MSNVICADPTTSDLEEAVAAAKLALRRAFTPEVVLTTTSGRRLEAAQGSLPQGDGHPLYTKDCQLLLAVRPGRRGFAQAALRAGAIAAPREGVDHVIDLTVKGVTFGFSLVTTPRKGDAIMALNPSGEVAMVTSPVAEVSWPRRARKAKTPFPAAAGTMEFRR